MKADDGIDSKISINPRNVKIQANTIGFFIAQSADEVKRSEEFNNFFFEFSIFYFGRYRIVFLPGLGSFANLVTMRSRTRRSSKSASAKTVRQLMNFSDMNLF